MDNISKLNHAKKFFDYKDLKEYPKNFYRPDVLDLSDDIQKLIYAPDPMTGIPSSDISFMLRSNQRPEVQQYILNTLQRPLPSSEKTLDSDLALASVKDRRETFLDYANRLKSLISNDNKNS